MQTLLRRAQQVVVDVEVQREAAQMDRAGGVLEDAGERLDDLDILGGEIADTCSGMSRSLAQSAITSVYADGAASSRHCSDSSRSRSW